jgi:hypothetical protein
MVGKWNAGGCFQRAMGFFQSRYAVRHEQREELKNEVHLEHLVMDNGPKQWTRAQGVDMEAQNSSNNPLLPFTKLVLGVSATVQVIFAVCMFFPDLWHSLLWPPPLPQMPDVARWFQAINYLGTAVAAIYALYQGRWTGAQVYFAFSFTYNAMAIIVSLIAAITNGIPLIMWLYVLLAVLYLSVVAFTWVRQSRRVSPRVA